MTEPDLTILDELRTRNRRAALRERGARTGRVVTSAPRPLGRRRPKPRTETKEQRQARTAAARAARAANAEAQRESELDLIADALLTICSRLNDEGYTAASQPDIVDRLRSLHANLPDDADAATCGEAAREIERLRRGA